LQSPPSPARNHLAAASLAAAIAAVAVLLCVVWCRQLERLYIHALAPEFTDEKLQGSALQKQAFAQPDLLVLYGSSELVKEIPNNASQFFADYPTGFRVFPVGKPGTASLAVLQKVAAVGESIRGRKVAYSISPGWFFSEVVDSKYYEGNFSAMQAMEVAFSSRLSWELRRDIARRMLDYPKTIDDHWLLSYALDRLAGDTLTDRAFYLLVRPLGAAAQLIGRTQDHFEAALHILDEDERLNPEQKRGLRALNWNELLKRTAQFASNTAITAKHNEVTRRKSLKNTRREGFLKAIATAKEWTDIELLMRTFHELGAQPLFLSMPIEDIRLEVYGLQPSARTAYLDRLALLTQRYNFAYLDFREHQTDAGFLLDFQDHLSSEGWLFYNKALDDFFHGRVSRL
jgi:D-alanine transfer protein